MATDLPTVVNELNAQNDRLRASNRQLAARIRDAEERAERGDGFIQGAMAVLRDHGYTPEGHEDLPGMLARVLRERVDAKRKRV